jgi:NTE family protein
VTRLHHRTARGPKAINLAPQGGGAHGAYTWSALDRLLEDECIVIEGISATSAGAMNVAALAQGLTEGGPERARETPEAFWRGLSWAASLSPCSRSGSTCATSAARAPLVRRALRSSRRRPLAGM